MKYQNCIFDLYGTLVDIHTEENSPQLWACMADYYRLHGASWQPEALQAAYLRLVGELEGGASSAGDTHEAHPEIQIERVFQALYQGQGVDASMELAVQTGLEFRRQSIQYIRLYDGAAELLRALRASGRGVWLLSNAQAIFTRWELDQLGLTPLFDGIYLSSDYGCKKPDPRFFQALLQDHAIPVETAVMVGNDGACDIRGAQAVGLSTVYIRSNISPKEPLPQADHVLDAMDLGRVRAILIEE